MEIAPQKVPAEHRVESARPGASALLRIWLRDVAMSIVLAMLIVTFLYQPVRVEGTSMAPHLQDRDRVFINKLAYRIGEVHRQDVVIFHYPNDPSKTYIKRVIAAPGDELRIDHGTVYLNGARLAEPYVAPLYRDTRSLPETRIPDGEFFVMGDHRNISSDSRDFGPVARSFIYGKAMFVYWPTDEAGWIR
jgi:signal peptidase I